jgi:heat shock protein HtpX
MKRILLFILTNLLVVVTISVVTSILGVNHYITAQGLDYSSLLGFCLVWGMGGAFISLSISRWSAKTMMGVRLINRNSTELAWVYTMVEQLSHKAGLPAVPEVGIWESAEVNAFATGPSKRRSLVAFSSGLLHSMDRNEIEGVAAHEIAHIANGDMVTMTLLQGVINAFVMFFARAIAWAVSQNTKEENRRLYAMLITIVLEIAFGILGMVVVCGFSRYREYRADRGGALYAGKGDMIAALRRLQANSKRYEHQPALAAFKISGGPRSWFSTHPPLDARIKALEGAQL